MEMRMMHQGLSPRVQHGEETDLRSQVFGAGGDGLQSFRRGLEENALA